MTTPGFLFNTTTSIPSTQIIYDQVYFAIELTINDTFTDDLLNETSLRYQTLYLNLNNFVHFMFYLNIYYYFR